MIFDTMPPSRYLKSMSTRRKRFIEFFLFALIFASIFGINTLEADTRKNGPVDNKKLEPERRWATLFCAIDKIPDKSPGDIINSFNEKQMLHKTKLVKNRKIDLPYKEWFLAEHSRSEYITKNKPEWNLEMIARDCSQAAQKLKINTLLYEGLILVNTLGINNVIVNALDIGQGDYRSILFLTPTKDL